MFRKCVLTGLLLLVGSTLLFAQQNPIPQEEPSAWAYLSVIVLCALLVGTGLLLRGSIVAAWRWLVFALLLVFGAVLGPLMEEVWFKTTDTFQAQIQDVLSVVIGAGLCFAVPWFISRTNFRIDHDAHKVLNIHKINQ